MMIDKRLINQVSNAKKYIAIITLINWLGLICNIFIIINIAYILRDLNFILLSEVIEMNLGEFLRTLKSIFIDSYETVSKFFVILGFVVAKMVCNFFAGKFAYYTSVEVKQVLREKIYRKLLNIGANYNQSISTSEVVQVSVEGVEQLEIYFSRYLPQLFYSLLAPITLFFVITPISFISALVLLLCVPLIPMSIIAVQKLAKKLFSKYWKEYTTLGDGFLDKLQGITTLKIYNVDEEKNQEMNKQAEVFRKITMRVLVMQLNSVSLMDLLAFGGAAIGVILAVSQLVSGKITFMGAVIIILLASEFFIPIRLLGSFFHIAMNGMSASEKIFRIIDTQDKPENVKTVKNGNIEFKNVNFGYDDRKILKNINLKIKENSLVSLVGESGCGKSTIASLVMSLKTGYQGNILVGGEEISSVNEDNLMKNITLVTHNSYIFKGTVEENLKMAKKDATKEEMEEVLRKVNLLDFVLEQGGLSFKLDEKGANLSGGQAQRLGLARAILHNSKIYIFDEATSNIDVESENIIIENIYNLAKEKTVLMISHRLFNVTKSDMIYTIKNGEIVEFGTHEELLNNKGVYFNIYNEQQSLEKYSKEVVFNA